MLPPRAALGARPTSTAPFRAKGFTESLHYTLVQHVDLQIRQRAILGAIGNFISQTLFPFRDRRAHILVKDFHMQIIFATDKVIAEKPQAVRAFMAAWLETIAFAKANKEKTCSIIQQVLGFHPDVLNSTYDRVINVYSTDGKFNPRALAVLARSYVELKLLDREPDMTKLYTEEFLPKK